MLAPNDGGHGLLRFESCPEEDIVGLVHAPLPLALIVVRRAGDILMVFDRWKSVWELPGGMIENGETPREAAVRELREETGVDRDQIDFLGLATYQIRQGHLEHGAVFECDLAEDPVARFEENDEIERLSWGTPGSRLEGLDSLDAYLATERPTG